MNYLYQRPDHDNVKSESDGSFLELVDLLRAVKPGDRIEFDSMSSLGMNSNEIIKTLETLARKKVAVSFLDENVVIDASELANHIEVIKIFHRANVDNERLQVSLSKRKRKEQARRAAALKGVRLKTALKIAQQYANDGLTAKQLAQRYKLGIATIYRYIKKYNQS